MVPQDNLYNFYKKIIFTFVGFIAIAIAVFFIIIPFVNFLQKPAYLDVLLLSDSLSVTIDDQSYGSGVYTVNPGHYEVKISKDGEHQVTLSLELGKNQTTGLYLDWTDAGLQQYALSDIEHQRKIDEIFPITFTACNGPASRTNCNAVKVVYGFDRKCGENKCIIISGRSAELTDGLLSEVKSQMSERGYDLDDYKYIYIQNTSI